MNKSPALANEQQALALIRALGVTAKLSIMSSEHCKIVIKAAASITTISKIMDARINEEAQNNDGTFRPNAWKRYSMTDLIAGQAGRDDKGWTFFDYYFPHNPEYIGDDGNFYLRTCSLKRNGKHCAITLAVEHF